ncbi:hypothetical protein PybrP1_006456 [[Pythium] brassicae (nom. inval.)]|nr:hypothetical protein PybrP1_006456 [[Pythium] brassicae (nom. inval.)]
MLLSRRRARGALSEETTALRRLPSSDRLIDETWFLRDLLDAYGGAGAADAPEEGQRHLTRHQMLEFLRRRNRIPHETHDALDSSLQRARARMSSQELFLGVVLEWQRSATEGVRLHQPRAVAAEANSMQSSRSHHEGQWGRYNDAAVLPQPCSDYESSASSDESSDTESEVEKAVSPVANEPLCVCAMEPASVHNVPRELTPLNLDFIASPATKRIGIYSPRARQELLRKYMVKRAKRLSQNKVRYRVRKTLANARPRVKGRFVKTEQPLTAALAESMGTS